MGEGGFLSQMDYKYVYAFTPRVSVRTETGKVIHVVLKSVLLQRPNLLLRLVEVVYKIPNEHYKAAFVETTGKCIANEGNGLFPIHYNEEVR